MWDMDLLKETLVIQPFQRRIEHIFNRLIVLEIESDFTHERQCYNTMCIGRLCFHLYIVI